MNSGKQGSFLYCLTPFDNPGIVRAQLTTEVRAVQPELTGYLRDIVFDVVQTLARLDGILVLGTSSGQLSAKRSQLDMACFLLAASDIVACQQQVAVIQGEITLESRHRHLAGTTDLRTGQPCRAVQLYRLAVLFLRFRLGNLWRAGFVMCVIWDVHIFFEGYYSRTATLRTVLTKRL